MKVLLYLKKSGLDKSGKAPIMGRITLGRSIALRHVQQSRKKGVITLRDSLYNDSLVLSNPKFSTYSYLKELRLKQH